jgi:6,7-dimethyl-8-ribityllumazine synthase
MATTIPSKARGAGLAVALLKARWYPEVVAGLAKGALATLRKAGVKERDVLVVDVPGSFELPQAALAVARRGGVDAIVAVGCVVRGETPHFDFVARACVDGLSRVALDTGIPVGLGVITADTLAQAKARSGPARGKGGNKGAEAAEAAVRLAATVRALPGARRP